MYSMKIRRGVELGLAAWLFVAAACVIPPPPPGPGASGTPTGDAAWVVRIQIGNQWCTGSVLTDHWVLTAAHCIPAALVSAPGAVTIAWTNLPSGLIAGTFDVTAQGIKHGTDDIGLLKLSGSGISTAMTGKASLWASPTPPAVPSFSMISWGLTGTSSSDTCDTSLPPPPPPPTKRLGTGFTLDPVAPGATKAKAAPTVVYPCQGDCGGSWVVKQGARYIEFVSHTARVTPPLKYEGVLTQPKRTWIEDQIPGTNNCLTSGNYFECSDAPTGVGAGPAAGGEPAD